MGGINDDSSRWDREGGCSTGRIKSIALGNGINRSFLGPATGALLGRSIEIKFTGGLGKNNRADVASLHDEVMMLSQKLKVPVHEISNGRKGGDFRNHCGYFGICEIRCCILTIKKELRPKERDFLT